MTRDADGLPDNLSPLNCVTTSWVDENGIHIAIYDRDKLPQGVLTRHDLLEELDIAEYVVTMSGAAAILLAESLLDYIGSLIRAGLPLNFPLGAPAPFPPDARRRIYERLHGIARDLPDAPPLTAESVFAQVDDILKGGGE